MKGLFSLPQTSSERVESRLPQCGRCGLYKKCKSPKMPINGNGKKRILIWGEAPGRTEDDRGIPFCGDAGRLLQSKLSDCGIDMREDCWIGNSLICRPPSNRAPTDKEIEYCRPNLTKALEELKPRVIIPLGGAPLKSILRGSWKGEVGPIGRWVGWQIPSLKHNAWICPNWHPSYLNRTNDPMLDLFFTRYLKNATGIRKRPWKEIPDYKAAVKVIIDPDEAARELRVMIAFLSSKKPVAFDLETDRLKPDSKDAQIICASVSNGTSTIAFPWHGKAIKEMRVLLHSVIPKIGYNLKFESRWLRKLHGWKIKNWQWDGMLAAHVLDSRPEITGLKFQSFVLLGQGTYDDKIKKYLQGEGGNGKNTIRRAPLPELLTYCGMDSLLEYKVAQIQMEQLHGC